MSNVQQMQDLYEAFGRGEIPVVLGAMDPGIEWRQAEGHPFQPSGMPFLGPDAILQNVFSRLALHRDAQEDRQEPGRPGLPHVEDKRRQDHQLPAVHGHRPVAGRG
jgi:hypothetical protein